MLEKRVKRVTISQKLGNITNEVRKANKILKEGNKMLVTEGEPVELKALSIRQPWAEALLKGVKSMEIRVWKSKYRGNLLIHASKTYADDAPLEIQECFPKEQHHQAGIVGICRMVNCIKLDYDTWVSRHDDHKNPITWFDDTRAQYGFEFEDIRRVDFTPYSGALRIFTVKGFKCPECKGYGCIMASKGMGDIAVAENCEVCGGIGVIL